MALTGKVIHRPAMTAVTLHELRRRVRRHFQDVAHPVAVAGTFTSQRLASALSMAAKFFYHDFGALAGVRFLGFLLDRRDGLVARQHAREREEAGLQDGIAARAEAQVNDLGCIDDEQLQFLVDHLLLRAASSSQTESGRRDC